MIQTVANMLKVLYKYFMPAKAVMFIPASPAGGPSLGKGQVHVCYKGTCKPPVYTVEAFEKEFLAGD